jgi:hypothetical protein
VSHAIAAILRHLSHFWNAGENAGESIRTVSNLGPDYTKEDVVWTVWEDLLRLYFPDYFLGPAGTRYRIRREPYRGSAARVEDHRPDIIAIRVSVAQPGAAEVSRDVLWVECKAPSLHKPHGWNMVMREAIDRLEVAHPNRNIFLILAIGIEWMMFEWDPNPNLPVSPLYILPYNPSDRPWNVDARIRIVAAAGPTFLLQRDPRRDPNGPYDLIDTSRANSLDYWTMDSTGQRQLNLRSIQRLENCLAHVQGAQYHGPANPAHFAL